MLRHYEENGLTTRMARFACEASHPDIPADVREYVKILAADFLACGFGAAILPATERLVASAERLGAADDAVILTTGKTASAAAAAFYLINALDADDTFYTSCHPLAPIFASGLAVAEEIGASGLDLITALAVGYDVAVRCKRSFVGGEQGSMGWFAMGCVATAGKLYGLDETEMAMAFGTAAFGSPHRGGRWNQMGPGRRHDMKYAPIQYSSFAGVTAAQLTKAGFTSDRTIFDGASNYATFLGYEGIDEALMFEDLCKRWWIAETSIKPWAVCRFSQVTITMLNEIIREQQLQPADIDAVQIQTWDFIASPWFSAPGEIATEFDAQFSFAHAVAATMLGWDMGPEWQARAIGNQELAAAAHKVSVVTKPNYARDSVITSEGGLSLGDPFEERFKASMAMVHDKFDAFAKHSLNEDRAARIFACVEDLESIPNVRFALTR